jgi:glycosyltransferase involved in cell wall biosynthesis
MKILLVNNMDTGGGSARAGYRLLVGLRAIGVDARMLVQSKLSTDPSVVPVPGRLSELQTLICSYLDAAPMLLYPRARWWKDTLDFRFTPAWAPNNTSALVNRKGCDVVNLHMVNRGFMGVRSLAKLNRPVVWTLHDATPFTGGCQYPSNCDRYKELCGKCPQLRSGREHDLSRWVWRQKKRHWKDLSLTFVTPSHWLADVARTSSIGGELRVEVIPNGLDAGIYKPLDKIFARNALNLSHDKKIILAGASQGLRHSRKGFSYLLSATRKLAANGWHSRTQVVVFGQLKPSVPSEFGLKTTYVGPVSDDTTLALLYSAADIFVAPSTEDNLPNTIIESMACGTPCVAFRIGGMPDMIQHQVNGFLAIPFESDDLARGMAWVLEDKQRWRALSAAARNGVLEEFTMERSASRYRDLFSEIITAAGR